MNRETAVTSRDASQDPQEVTLEVAESTLAEPVPSELKRQALVVLGMHRSGTSAVTRLVSLLGADLPRQLMKPVPGVNDTGFWEPVSLVDLNDEVLASGGSFWDDISEFPPSWYASATAQVFRERVVDLLRQDFAQSALFVLKDPRICRLVPFWIEALEAFPAEPFFVIPIRNPLAVAASLKARNGFLPAKSHLLWLRHLLEAERHTRDRRRSFVTYEHLLDDWRQIAARLSRELGLEWPRQSHQSEMEVESFLSQNLRHHVFSAHDVEAHEEVPDSVKRAFRVATEATRGKDTGVSEVFDFLRTELNAADRVFGTLVVQGRWLRSENEELNRKLDQRESDLSSKAIEADHLRKASISQHREVERLSFHIDTLQRQAIGLNQKVLQLDGQMKGTREEVEYWHRRWKCSREEIDQLEEQLKRAREEARSFQEGLAESQKEKGRMAEENDRMAEENDRLAEENDRTTEENDRLAEENGRRVKEADRMAKEADRMAKEYSDLKAHAARLEKKIDFIKKIPLVKTIWRLGVRNSSAESARRN